MTQIIQISYQLLKELWSLQGLRNLFNNRYIYKEKVMSQLKNLLDNYLQKDTVMAEKDLGNGYKEVCDLQTGDCYTVRLKDGLIERVDNTMKLNRTLKVETPTGVKTLLRD